MFEILLTFSFLVRLSGRTQSLIQFFLSHSTPRIANHEEWIQEELETLVWRGNAARHSNSSSRSTRPSSRRSIRLLSNTNSNTHLHSINNLCNIPRSNSISNNNLHSHLKGRRARRTHPSNSNNRKYLKHRPSRLHHSLHPHPSRFTQQRRRSTFQRMRSRTSSWQMRPRARQSLLGRTWRP